MITPEQYSNLHPYGLATFSFKGEIGELSFEEGEVIELTRYIDGEWMEGRKGGINGLVPISYIQVIIPPEDGGNEIDMGTTSSDQSIGIAHILHDFNGESTDELSLKEGSQIKVISYVNDEWIRCYDPMSDCVGIVPVSFVQIYMDHESEECVLPSTGCTTSTHHSLTTSVTALPLDVWSSGWEYEKREEDMRVKKLPPRPPVPSKDALEILKEKKKNGDVREGRRNDSNDYPMKEEAHVTNKTLFVVSELVSSENSFFLDIISFVSAVNDSKMSKPDAEILCGMMGPIIQLSMSLHESLSIQNKCDDVSKLCVGKVFLEYRKSFSQVYSFYFRQLESAYKIIERPDNEEIMKEMMNSMKSSLPDTSCIEITATVMRPIQRCLKYPLLLTQLVKSLPLNHRDHPKLVEAVKQMSNLASKMNESRRRRELVNKYNTESKKSIGDRISTINLHSLSKKSSRLTTRIGKTIGFIDLPKDSSMENLLSKLYKVERSCVHFIYYLTVHMKKVQNVLVNEKGLKELCPSLDSSSLVKKTSMIAQNWSMNVNLNVRFVVERAMREIPKKLIQKREDKLLDYYNALKKSVPNMVDKKREYEALSVQLRQKLPFVINSITRSLEQAWIVLRDLHNICEGAMSDLIKEEKGIKGEMNMPTPISRISLHKIRSISAMVRKEFGKAEDEEKEKERKGENEYVQTAEDRMNVWSNMSTNAFKKGTGVFKVNDEWPGSRLPTDDLVCSIGDLVYVEQSTKNNDIWECWNGKKKGLIHSSILSPLSMGQMGRPQSTPLRPTPTIQTHTIGHPTTPTNTPNLIDMDIPSECSIPVLQASNMTKRIPSLPSFHSISNLDPFDEFSSLRISSVPRPNVPLASSIPIHQSPFPIVSSSNLPPHPLPYNPLPWIHNASHNPPLTTPSLSTNVLQPTQLTSSPIRVNPHSSQYFQLSSTNPFKDICDTPPS